MNSIGAKRNLALLAAFTLADADHMSRTTSSRLSTVYLPP
jgi:hypothetical protein